jgi:hypothetical protein
MGLKKGMTPIIQILPEQTPICRLGLRYCLLHVAVVGVVVGGVGGGGGGGGEWW